MNAQPDFFESFELTPREKFEQFHHENPQVFKTLREMALKAKRADYKIGMKGLFEVLRWNRKFRTEHGADYKLNNNYTAFYVRLLEEKEPELRGFFNKRKSKAA